MMTYKKAKLSFLGSIEMKFLIHLFIESKG